jgi:type II secretory pathway predicted ATPase ExeA
MMLEHFGLTREPFARDIPVDELMRFEAHREMTVRLQFAAEHRQTAMVTGDTGTGKTTAIRAVMKRMDDSRYRFMYIASRSLTPKTLYRELLERLQIQPRFRHTDNQALTRQALEESFTRGIQWIIAIDEAHELEASMLAEFRFLLNFHADSFSPLSLWLIGQSELRDKLRLRVLASLTQRIQVRYQMTGLREQEVTSYIEEQLKRAGRDLTLFSEDAVTWAAKASQGNPRLIGSLCRAALIDAAARKNPRIEIEHMERAWNEVNG